MSYREKDFLDLLDKRAVENRTDVNKWGKLTPWIRRSAYVIGVNPWKVIVPVSIILSLGAAVWLRGGWVSLASWLQGMF